LRLRNLSPEPRRIASGVYAGLHWGCYRRTANPSADEPCASKTQARICGSPGRVTARGDPAVGRLRSSVAQMRDIPFPRRIAKVR